MQEEERLKQLRISTLSILRHTCEQLAEIRKSKNMNHMELIELKLKRTSADKLISKIDNAIRKKDYSQYSILYDEYKKY